MPPLDYCLTAISLKAKRPWVGEYAEFAHGLYIAGLGMGAGVFVPFIVGVF
jgi:hypothetical protein